MTHKFVKRTSTPDLSNAFGISSVKTQAVPEMLQAVTFRQLQLSKSLYSREKTKTLSEISQNTETTIFLECIKKSLNYLLLKNVTNKRKKACSMLAFSHRLLLEIFK